MKWAVYGNRGQYQMPESPEFTDYQAALDWVRVWYPDNPNVIVALAMTSEELRTWLNEEEWIPYVRSLEEQPCGFDGRHVTRWIAHGYGSVDDAIETYRRHHRLVLA